MEHNRDATLAQLDDFDEIIDVRSPAEYALDHIPGALNCPVLDDAERARVGTLYKQVSPFAAKRIGAALVARNIATMLETTLSTRPPGWTPLVYCWRGGGRSDALCELLRRVGWRAARLQGGYRAYRRAVVSDLERLPRTFELRVLCGRTGAGKSQVLQALAELGAQVLDLEAIACHRGSVLGDVPGQAQPTQKLFESRLRQRLRALDPARPVFVEAESRKIGNVQVPGALITAMRAASCVVLETPVAVRTALLLADYAHLRADPALVEQRLEALTAHYGRARVAEWCGLARRGAHAELVAQLLATHYDPSYDRSIARNFTRVTDAITYRLESASAAAVRSVAAQILADCMQAEPA